MSNLYEQDLMDYFDYHWQKAVIVETEIHKAVKGG